AFGLPRFEIGPPEPGREKERIVFEGASGLRRSLDNRVWKLVPEDKSGETRKITYCCTVEKFTITKTFTISKDSRTVRADISVENGTAAPVSYAYSLYGPAGVLPDTVPNDTKTTSMYGAVVIKAELGGRENSSSEDVDIRQIDTA